MIETISVVVLSASTDSPTARAALGSVAALVIALAARAARALDWTGVIAAVACGTICAAAGWTWAATLIGYFVASTLISRAGRADKERRTASVIAKGGARDAAQVLANGGLYSLAAAAMLLQPDPLWAWAALGALAVSAADTWATEIGVLAGQRPISIIGRTYVQPGMSGGVTLPGIAGAFLGAAVVCAIADTAGFPRGATLAALVTGWMGAMIDSLLGATVQQRRRCDICGEDTELTVHPCGTETRHVAGIHWMDNDVINFLATLAGFLLSAALYLVATGLIARSAGV